MFIEDKIIYKMVEFWYNMNEQRNGGVAFLSTKPSSQARPGSFGFFLAFKASKNQSNAKGIVCLPYRQLGKEIM